MGKDVDNYLSDLYYNLDNPESYSSVEKIFCAGKKKAWEKRGEKMV